MVDLWISQPSRFLSIALDDGFRRFTWHTAESLSRNREMLSWFRANTVGYGTCELLMIDHAGASLYTNYSNYTSPVAVYPTWSPDEPEEDLLYLMANNVGNEERFYNSDAPTQYRPVKGQEHIVVVHRIPPAGDERQLLSLRLREIQLDYPDAKMFVSGMRRFPDLFGYGFGAVDYYPHALGRTGASTGQFVIPTGKNLSEDAVFTRRYEDWFNLVGMEQAFMLDPDSRILMCLRSARWASMFWDSVVPFVRSGGGSGGAITLFKPDEYNMVSDKDFVLPAARRRLMRRVGLNATELDKFQCNTCILMNACSLFREDAVCAVKGSETVGLADAFGSRNVDVLIGGLSQLLKRNAERLEDAMAEEEQAADGLDPEVTKLTKTVFDQGTKLAKLIDPALAGGPKVQVNVGVGSGGSAQVAIAQSDPKQLMATIVAELEASGISREEITSDMVKGVLRSMANVPQAQAVSTISTLHKSKKEEQRAITGQIIRP